MPYQQRQMPALRGSADALEQRHNDPFRPPHVGHPPDAFVLADATDQSIALGSCPIDRRLKRSLTSNDTLRNPSSLAIAAGEPGTASGRTNLASSRRPPSPGAVSMTISVRESGMPQTVSKNSPSTNALPSTPRPSPTKKAVTTSSSATVRPTWSKRRTYDIERAPVVVSNMYPPRQAAFTVPKPTEEAGRHRVNVHNSAREGASSA